MLEPHGERLGETALAHLGLRAPDGIRNAPEGYPAALEIEHEVGGSRVAVARLAHRSRVQEPAFAFSERYLSIAWGNPTFDLMAAEP